MVARLPTVYDSRWVSRTQYTVWNIHEIQMPELWYTGRCLGIAGRRSCRLRKLPEALEIARQRSFDGDQEGRIRNDRLHHAIFHTTRASRSTRHATTVGAAREHRLPIRSRYNDDHAGRPTARHGHPDGRATPVSGVD